MKKIAMLSMLVFSMIVGGCSQSSQQAAESKPTSTSVETKSKNPKSDFPNKPIEVIVPTPAGGSYDTVARTFEKVLPKYLPNGQSIVVVNKPGGSNTIGVAEVFKAKPDGYTIGFVPSSTITTMPHYGNTPYTYDSFQPIMRAAQVPGIMFVPTDAPYKTFEEWLAYVKQNPEKFSVSTVAGAKNLLQSINREAGIKMKIVPFEGFAPAMTALLGGHVQGTVATLADGRAPLESGSIHPLFTSSGKAPEGLKVPTLKDLGINIEENKLIGFIAPKGIPADALQILHEALKKANEDPEVQEQIKKLGMDMYYGSPEQFQEDLNKNFKIDGDILKKSGLIK